jgi:hypothetical protein
MLRHRVFSTGLIAALAITSGCGGDGYVDHAVRVIIPPDIKSMPQGSLKLQLWSYDRSLADAPASLIDDNIVQFSHERGRTTQRDMHVSGNTGSSRNRHYITVRGFERVDGQDVYMLWDGIRGTQTPRVVVMEYVAYPVDSRVAAR